MAISQFFRGPVKSWFSFLAFTCGLVVIVSGCGKKVDVQSQTSELEKAFAAASQAQGSSTAADCIKAAVAAVKASDYLTGIQKLQDAVKAGDVTPAQLSAVEGAQTALYTELASRAEKGDAKAKQALQSLAKARP